MRRSGITQRDFNKVVKKHGGLFATGLLFLFGGIQLLLAGIIMMASDGSGGFIAIGVICVLIGIAMMIGGKVARKREAEEREAQALAREQRFLQSNITVTDNMSGETFEDFLSAVLKNVGYNVRKTKRTGDYGVDLILQKGETQIIVQAKRYKNKVSVNAIQEISAAKNYYKIYNAWVITNNYFTAPAKNLAAQNQIRLIDRDGLVELILQARSLADQKKAS